MENLHAENIEFRGEAGLRAELRARYRRRLSRPENSSAVWSKATETKEERLREERSRLLQHRGLTDMNYNTNQEFVRFHLLALSVLPTGAKKGGGKVNTSNQCLNYHLAAAPLLT